MNVTPLRSEWHTFVKTLFYCIVLIVLGAQCKVVECNDALQFDRSIHRMLNP